MFWYTIYAWACDIGVYINDYCALSTRWIQRNGRVRFYDWRNRYDLCHKCIFIFRAGSSDDGGGGDTDGAGRSDDERSLSCSEASSGRSSLHSDNNNSKKDVSAVQMALDESGIGTGIGTGIGLNSFNFFELPTNAAALPYNLEIRNAGSDGVWTKTQLPKGVKYGPFLGKWGSKPVDSRFAWEVSEKSKFFLYLRHFFFAT